MHDLLAKVLDEIRGSWRFRWWAIAAAWGVCLAGWTYVMFLPNIYQASARVYLDSQSALRPLLRGLAIDPDVESDLGQVRQALLSRPALEKVARRTDLDLHAQTPKQKEMLITGLQKSILIETDMRARNSSTDGVYKISFQHASRVKSLDVVQTLLDNFVEDTLGSKRTGQADAQRFLKEQIADYEKRLSDAENRLSEFKKENVGKMPDNRGDYFVRMQTEMTNLEAARHQLALVEARRDELTRQMSGEEPFVFGFDSSAPTGPNDNKLSGDLSGRIQDLEGRLEELLLRYTDKHPEVIAVRRTMEELRSQRDAEMEKVKRERKVDVNLSSSMKANPVYQGMENERRRASLQIAELQRDVSQRQTAVAELRRFVDSVPEVEAGLARLNRDYEVTRAQYQQLVQRMETAKLSEDADRTGTVKFQVIDPPSVAIEPVAPKRFILLLAVLFAGVGGAVALAYSMNQIWPVFQNVRSLREITGLTVLGSVSRTILPQDTVRERLGLLGISGSFAVLILLFGVVMVSRNALSVWLNG